MRRLIIAVLLLVTPAIAQTPAAVAPDSFKFMGHDELDKRLSSPEPGRTFGTAVVSDHHEKNYYVEFVKRFDHGNQVEVHPLWIDQVAIVSGEGVLTYGGTVSDAKVAPDGEVRGSSQVGAMTKKLQSGDFVLIPAGEPHEFDAVAGKTLTYVILKVRP